MHLVPEPVKPRGLRVVEHQARKVMVLAIVERERDDFIHGNDFSVAERGGENLAKLVQRGFNAAARGAAVVHHDGRGVNERLVGIRPGALAAGNRRGAGDQARRSGGFRGDHLQLHAAFLARLAIQRAGGNKLAALHEVRRQADLDERRRLDA